MFYYCYHLISKRLSICFTCQKSNATVFFLPTCIWATDPFWKTMQPIQVILYSPTQSVQFSSVAQSYLTLCDLMKCSTPGLPVHYQLPKSTQTHVHRVGEAIQPFHPLSSPSPSVFNFSQHQGLFKWVSSSHQVARVLEFQLWHQSFQWIFRTDFL